MSMIFILLPLGLIFTAAAVILFVWAVRAGQFDDLKTPPVRILFDDPAPRPQERPGEQERSESP